MEKPFDLNPRHVQQKSVGDPNNAKTGLSLAFSIAENEGFQRFHNHGKGPD